MADAGNLQQLLHGAGPLRGHIQKRCVGKHDIGRDALLLRDAEAKRLQRGQKRLVRPGRSCFFSAFSARRASYAARAQAPVRRKTAQPLPAPSCRSRRGRDQSPDIPRAPAARSILESARPAARTSVRRSAANQAPAPARVPNGPRAAFGLESTRQRSSRAGSAPAQRRTGSSAPRA